jgi:hypothetical protein
LRGDLQKQVPPPPPPPQKKKKKKKRNQKKPLANLESSQINSKYIDLTE